MISTRLTNSHPVDRRRFLQGMGVVLALPWLESEAMVDAPRTKRLVCVGNHLGFYPGNFFPKAAGKDYVPSSTLNPLEKHRDDLTVFSNLDHGLNGGHRACRLYPSDAAADPVRVALGGRSITTKDRIRLQID